MPKAPTKAQLLTRLQELEGRTLMRQPETIIDPRNEPASTLATITAERVHAAIASSEQGDTRELFAIYRDVYAADSHLQGLLNTRFLAVLGDDPLVTPGGKKQPEDVAAADAIRLAIDRLPDFMGICADLLWGNFWPVSLVERTYKPAEVDGLRFDWGDIVPVPDHLFRWTNGFLEVERVDAETRRTTGQWERPSPSRYVTFKDSLWRLPETWGGPMRALTWWFFLKVMDRDWWVRFLDRFGTPFTVAKFEKNDDRSRQILERALKLSSRIGGIVVSTGTSVELAQANTSAADAHQRFFEICNDEMSRRVLGQTLSSTASPTGLGSGASELQGQVRGDITQYDKKQLARVIREQMFKPWLRLNGFTGAVPVLTFGGEQDEANATTAEVLSKFKMAGLRVADKSLGALSQRVGLEIERDPSPAAPAGVKTLSALPSASDPARAVDAISREAAAMLALAYRGALAPAREILLTSQSPEEATTRLLSAFGDWDASKAAEVVESAFAAGCWNGFAD